jgi:cytochrome bd-type quinol oxidase subunit 2
MKKYLYSQILTAFFCLFFICVSATQAASLNDAFSSNTLAPAAQGYNTKADVYSIIGTTIQALLSLLGVIFILLIVYGGVTWMTAEGEETKVEKAQKIIRNAVIGLIIVIASYAISYFVISIFHQQTT